MNKNQDYEGPVEKSKDDNSNLPLTEGEKSVDTSRRPGSNYLLAGEQGLLFYKTNSVAFASEIFSKPSVNFTRYRSF